MSFTFNSIAQETEQFYFDKAAKEYYNGKMEASRKTIDLGLKYYPGNQKLIKLKNCLARDPEKPKWDAYNNKVKQIKAQGYIEGIVGEGYTSQEITDPKGKKHVFVKKVDTPRTPAPVATPKKCLFNEQERSLLSRGFKEGYGSDGDEEKSLTDCNGTVHQYYKKKKEKIITINTGFREVSQNTMSWSEDLKKYAKSITIVYSSGKKTEEYNVTGVNRHVFQSGDKSFDGVQVKVYLKVVLPENVTLKGITQEIIYTVCDL